jgi:hypothetical protein
MVPVWPGDPRRCLPLFFGEEPTTQGNRIGGTPPENVRPNIVTTKTEYLLTLQLFAVSDLELSVFLTHGEQDKEMFASGDRILSDEIALQMVLHNSAAAADNALLSSRFLCRRLIFGNQTVDSDEWREDLSVPRFRSLFPRVPKLYVNIK